MHPSDTSDQSTRCVTKMASEGLNLKLWGPSVCVVVSMLNGLQRRGWHKPPWSQNKSFFYCYGEQHKDPPPPPPRSRHSFFHLICWDPSPHPERLSPINPKWPFIPAAAAFGRKRAVAKATEEMLHPHLLKRQLWKRCQTVYITKCNSELQFRWKHPNLLLLFTLTGGKLVTIKSTTDVLRHVEAKPLITSRREKWYQIWAKCLWNQEHLNVLLNFLAFCGCAHGKNERNLSTSVTAEAVILFFCTFGLCFLSMRLHL